MNYFEKESSVFWSIWTLLKIKTWSQDGVPAKLQIKSISMPQVSKFQHLVGTTSRHLKFSGFRVKTSTCQHSIEIGWPQLSFASDISIKHFEIWSDPKLLMAEWHLVSNWWPQDRFLSTIIELWQSRKKFLKLEGTDSGGSTLSGKTPPTRTSLYFFPPGQGDHRSTSWDWWHNNDNWWPQIGLLISTSLLHGWNKPSRASKHLIKSSWPHL